MSISKYENNWWNTRLCIDMGSKNSPFEHKAAQRVLLSAVRGPENIDSTVASTEFVV